MSFNVPDDAANIRFSYTGEDPVSETMFRCGLTVEASNAEVQDKAKLVELLIDAVEAYRLHINSINTTVSFLPEDELEVYWDVPGQDTYDIP